MTNKTSLRAQAHTHRMGIHPYIQVLPNAPTNVHSHAHRARAYTHARTHDMVHTAAPAAGDRGTDLGLPEVVHADGAKQQEEDDEQVHLLLSPHATSKQDTRHLAQQAPSTSKPQPSNYPKPSRQKRDWPTQLEAQAAHAGTTGEISHGGMRTCSFPTPRGRIMLCADKRQAMRYRAACAMRGLDEECVREGAWKTASCMRSCRAMSSMSMQRCKSPHTTRRPPRPSYQELAFCPVPPAAPHLLPLH